MTMLKEYFNSIENITFVFKIKIDHHNNILMNYLK